MSSLTEHIIRRIFVIPICLIVFLVLGVVSLSRQTPIYRVGVLLARPDISVGQSPEQFDAMIMTDMRVATTGPIISEVRQQMDVGAEVIASNLVRLAAKPLKGSTAVAFAVDSFDPIFATDFANKWATIFIKTMVATNRHGYRVVEMARPPSSPVNIRKTETIFWMSILGLGSGSLLSLLLAIIGKTKEKILANNAVEGMAPR